MFEGVGLACNEYLYCAVLVRLIVRMCAVWVLVMLVYFSREREHVVVHIDAGESGWGVESAEWGSLITCMQSVIIHHATERIKLSWRQQVNRQIQNKIMKETHWAVCNNQPYEDAKYSCSTSAVITFIHSLLWIQFLRLILVMLPMIKWEKYEVGLLMKMKANITFCIPISSKFRKDYQSIFLQCSLLAKREYHQAQLTAEWLRQQPKILRHVLLYHAGKFDEELETVWIDGWFAHAELEHGFLQSYAAHFDDHREH